MKQRGDGRIVVCGSISAAREMVEVKKELEARGFVVKIPEGVEAEWMSGKTERPKEERARDKIERDLILGYYREIQKSDAVLVVNPSKNGMEGYIGGNTFLEMGFAYVLGKPLYCLYPLPEMAYSAELMAMEPMVLEGGLDKMVV